MKAENIPTSSTSPFLWARHRRTYVDRRVLWSDASVLQVAILNLRFSTASSKQKKEVRSLPRSKATLLQKDPSLSNMLLVLQFTTDKTILDSDGGAGKASSIIGDRTLMDGFYSGTTVVLFHASVCSVSEDS